MRIDKVAYNQFKIGPGGRKCTCCAPPSQILKDYEHRKARQYMKKYIRREVAELNADD